MTPEDLQNAKDWRDFYKWLVTTLLLAAPGLVNLCFSYSNSSELSEGKKDRGRIEEKIDEHTITLKVAADEATSAAVTAKEVAKETKMAVQETKVAIEAIKPQ